MTEKDQAPEEQQQTETAGAATVVSATGVIVPQKYANLSMKAAGVVAEILVTEGEYVQAGQPLVRLAGGDPQNPSPEIMAAIQMRELEVEAAQQALDNLDEQAQSLALQAEQALNNTISQIRDLQYQLENLDLPESQESLDPLEAYDQALEAYHRAQEAFAVYQDEPASNSVRRQRKEDLDAAKEDYDLAVTRLQLSLALDLAEANRDKARRDWEKYRNGPTASDLLQAARRLNSAKANLEAAQAVLNDLTLRAPFAGTISEVNLRVGEWVTPGLPVVILADLDNLWIETTDLNEIDMVQISVADPVMISFDALPETMISGRVISIANKASPGVGVNYRVIIAMDETPPGLRWGMSAFVDIQPRR